MIRVGILLLCVLSAVVRAQTSVELKRGVRVDASGPVTLANVATITGDDADSLGSLVLIPDLHAEHVTPGQFEIDVERVRQVLERKDGINWALVSLSGSTCRLIPVDSGELEALRQHLDRSTSEPGTSSSGPTLRDAIRWRIAAHFGVEQDDLRLGFDPRDAKELATSTLGRLVEVTPTGESDNMPLRYTIYDGDRVEHSGTLSVQTTIKRDVVVTSQPLQRGDIADLSLVSVEERWVGPSVSPADPRDVVGKEIRSALPAGAVVERSAVDEPVVVERGDKVMIECVTGGFVVKSEAWALENGRDGEIIRFKSVDDQRGQRPFNARLNGSGRAVAVVNPTVGPLPQAGDQP